MKLKKFPRNQNCGEFGIGEIAGWFSCELKLIRFKKDLSTLISAFKPLPRSCDWNGSVELGRSRSGLEVGTSEDFGRIESGIEVCSSEELGRSRSGLEVCTSEELGKIESSLELGPIGSGLKVTTSEKVGRIGSGLEVRTFGEKFVLSEVEDEARVVVLLELAKPVELDANS